jgi:hypothetical protein
MEPGYLATLEPLEANRDMLIFSELTAVLGVY